MLTSKPALQYPDFSKPFVVVTDASQTGVGEVQMQDHGGGLQPVAFASATCRKKEAKYGVSELECTAMVWDLEQFRPHVMVPSDIDHGPRRAQMTYGKEGSTGKIASVGIEPVEIGPWGDPQTRKRKRGGRRIVSTACSDGDRHGNSVRPDLAVGSRPLDGRVDTTEYGHGTLRVSGSMGR